MGIPLVEHRLTLANRVGRAIWNIVWLLLFRPSPVGLHSWRRFLLRIFGASISDGAVIYPSARIWAPWNLHMGATSCLSHFVDCYCVAKISLGERVTVSQYSYLCSASRDFKDSRMPLVIAPIAIEDHAWIAAKAYVGPGTHIGNGAVVGACAVVVSDVPACAIYAGNPARKIGMRNPISIEQATSLP